MTLQVFGGLSSLRMPNHPLYDLLQVPILLDETLDAAAEACHMVGHLFLPAMTGSKTISAAGSGKIHWIVGAATITFANGGTNLRVGIQDWTTGVPLRGDGTFDVYADLVGGTDTLTAATAVSTTMETGTKTITHNDLIAVVFNMTARAGADSVKVRNGTLSATFQRSGVTFEAAAVFTARSAIPICAIEFDDGTIGIVRGGWITNVGALSTGNAVSTASTPDEYCQIIRFPQQVQIDSLWAIIGMSGTADGELILYSTPFGTPAVIEAVAIDGATVQTTSQRICVAGLSTVRTLEANTDYGVAVRPTVAVTMNIPTFSVAATTHWDVHSLGPNTHLATRSDNTGAFTATTTSRLFAGVGLCAVHDGASGGGLMRHPGMAGGLNA